jgi:hypothetical protein
MNLRRALKRTLTDRSGKKEIADLEAALVRSKQRRAETKKRLGDTERQLEQWQRRFELFTKGPGTSRDDEGGLAFVDERAAVAEYATIAAIRAKAPVVVDQPLVLISQIQRSGGTFLSQLFDDHPQCHAHPHELHIGRPQKNQWPALDMSATPDEWFDALQEEAAVFAFRGGFSKPGSGTAADVPTYPFLLAPGLQRTIFEERLSVTRPESQRAVLDAYFTSYFNGWLDNQNLYSEPKRVVTAFVPGLSATEGQLERFFADYPDGWFVSIVREPRSWYASASRHKSTRWSTLEEGCEEWSRSTRAAIDAAARRPDRTIIVSFEDLLTNADAMFGAVTERIGIEAAAATPTFNGRPATANSSFPVSEAGVRTESAQRHEALSESDAEAILARTADLHATALGIAMRAG